MCYLIIEQVTQPGGLQAPSYGEAMTPPRRVTVRETARLLDIKTGSYYKWRTQHRATLSGAPGIGEDGPAPTPEHICALVTPRIQKSSHPRDPLVQQVFDAHVKRLFQEHKCECGYRRLVGPLLEAQRERPATALLNLTSATTKTVRLSMVRQGLAVKQRPSFKPQGTSRNETAQYFENLLLSNARGLAHLPFPIDTTPLDALSLEPFAQHSLLLADGAEPLRLAATQPHQVLVSDITYVPVISLASGWGYLVAWQDQFTKVIESWAVAHQQTGEWVAAALRVALVGLPRRCYPVICHADGGSQYTGDDVGASIAGMQTVRSITRRANTYDNAQAESLWARIKVELNIRHGRKRAFEFEDLRHMSTVISKYVTYYNAKRPHSALNNLAPTAFAEQWASQNTLSQTPSLVVVVPEGYANKVKLKTANSKSSKVL